MCYFCTHNCGNSSVGRARPCQGRGREFESRFPLKNKEDSMGPLFLWAIVTYYSRLLSYQASRLWLHYNPHLFPAIDLDSQGLRKPYML
jgi:hypothetical protein